MGAFVRDANTFSQRVAPRGTNRREGAEQASDAPRSAAVDRRVEDDLRPHAHLVLAWCSTVLEGALAFKDPEEQSAHILAALSTRRPTAADTFVSVANGIIKDAKSALCSQQTSTTVGELQNTLIHAQIDIRSVREFFESTVDFQGGKISPCLWLCGVVQAVEEICSKLHEVRVAKKGCYGAAPLSEPNRQAA
jgi:hypothetical protein